MKCRHCDRALSKYQAHEFGTHLCGICFAHNKKPQKNYDWSKVPVDFSIQDTQGAWSRAQSIDRSVHGKDILQPFKKDGTVNKHFVQAHGTESLKKNFKMSEKEIRSNVEKYG